MLRLLSDENFNGELVRGLLRKQQDLELVRVQDAGLMGLDDPSILKWAAANERVLLTHDRCTVPRFAYDRVREGERMPGVFVVHDRMGIGQAIEEILLFTLCSEEGEWEGQVLYL